MNCELLGVTYSGPPIDDRAILEWLDPDHSGLLEQLNGFVAFSGGLHVRGACLAPEWHSLRTAWEGRSALHALYGAVEPDDVPFGQDALGDQFLLRDGTVHRLFGEDGEIVSLDVGLGEFLERVCADPLGYLDLTPLEQFLADGGRLEPGQLLSAYPPFVTDGASGGMDLEAVAAADRLEFLADLARRIRNRPASARGQSAVDLDPRAGS